MVYMRIKLKLYNMPGIDYIIIGAHRAGSSWIYKIFQELSDFSNIPIKEFHYFDFDNNQFRMYKNYK